MESKATDDSRREMTQNEAMYRVNDLLQRSRGIDDMSVYHAPDQ
jgi:hypothetical protein